VIKTGVEVSTFTTARNGDFITIVQANAGLRFTPAVNSLVTGQFTVQASVSNSNAGLGGNTVVAQISITPALIGTGADDAFVLTASGTAPGGTFSVTISSNGGPAVAFGTFSMSSPLTIDGMGGNDSIRIVGTAGSDTIIVNSSTSLAVNGSELILTSIENKTLAGAAGSDVYRFDADSVLGVWLLDDAGGTDTVDFSPTTTVDLSLNMAFAGTQTVHANNLRLSLGSGASIENAIGGSGADALIGNSLDNTLMGGAGDDRLIGAAGSDSLSGGADNDTYFFGLATAAEADQVTEHLNEGSDTLNFVSLTTNVALHFGANSVQTVHANRTLRLNSPITFEDDVLTGGGNSDWFFRALDDVITDLVIGELIDVL
jgi:Ca2+-binding RTX toxin-like protein